MYLLSGIISNLYNFNNGDAKIVVQGLLHDEVASNTYSHPLCVPALSRCIFALKKRNRADFGYSFSHLSSIAVALSTPAENNSVQVKTSQHRNTY